MNIGGIRIFSALFALLWMATIYYLSSLSRIDVDLGFSGQDKILHAGAYGLLTLFMLGAAPLRATGYELKHVLGVIVLATLYGCGDEWHQSFVAGRSPDLLDIVADFTGAAIAAFAARYASQLWGARRQAY